SCLASCPPVLPRALSPFGTTMQAAQSDPALGKPCHLPAMIAHVAWAGCLIRIAIDVGHLGIHLDEDATPALGACADALVVERVQVNARDGMAKLARPPERAPLELLVLALHGHVLTGLPGAQPHALSILPQRQLQLPPELLSSNRPHLHGRLAELQGDFQQILVLFR